jgi:hypothetical protein
MGFLFSLSGTIVCAVEEEKLKDDEEETLLDPTEFLPGPAGIPIKVPKLMERQLKKHRAQQSRILGGGDSTYFVIGLLETTHTPRNNDINELGRVAALIFDVLMLPISIPAGEPGFLTSNLGPPPPDWYRSDVASIHKVKGKGDALTLIYTFTTERLLDPPDPQVLHRQRQWFLIARTKKADEALAVERAAIKSIEEKSPGVMLNKKLGEGNKVLADLDAALEDPNIIKKREAIQELLNDFEEFKPEEALEKLRKLREELLALVAEE